MVDLANKLCDKYDITIFTIYAKGELEKQLSNKVKLKTIYAEKYSNLSDSQRKRIPIKIFFQKKAIYKKYIKGDYDVEIAFLEGPVTRLFSVKNKNTRKIAWIHNDISQVFGKGIKAKLKKKLDRKTYSKYDLLVFVSKDNLKKFSKAYPELRNEYLEPVKKEVIYNYIDSENVKKKAQEEQEKAFNKESINFVTVARLVPQKAIDRLINVHKKLIDNGLEHNFYVIGDGPEREKLEKLVNEDNIEKKSICDIDKNIEKKNICDIDKNIEKKSECEINKNNDKEGIEKVKENNINRTFHLLGQKENPYPYIKNADYFCLLSKFEGYGMVLEEAKILGKPIIITDTAAREAVENYKMATILENSEEEIYKGLKKIILNHKKHKKAKQEEQEKTAYDNSKIIEKVIQIIENSKEQNVNKKQ